VSSASLSYLCSFSTLRSSDLVSVCQIRVDDVFQECIHRRIEKVDIHHLHRPVVPTHRVHLVSFREHVNVHLFLLFSTFGNKAPVSLIDPLFLLRLLCPCASTRALLHLRPVLCTRRCSRRAPSDPRGISCRHGVPASHGRTGPDRPRVRLL